MKIPPHNSRSEQGTTVMLVLVVLLLVSIGLSNYLRLVGTQRFNIARSQYWNAAMPLAEAAIEEAMSHLNHNGTAGLNNDGWSADSDHFQLVRALGHGNFLVKVWPDEAATAELDPIIEATGSIPLPASLGEAGFVRRTIRVTALNDAMFPMAMVAKGRIDLKGNNIQTDSFDSTDPLYSTNGKYDPLKARDNGHVATNSGLVNSLNIGNANIRGRVGTGPGGSVAHGAKGGAGNAAWHAAGSSGIQPGWSRNDMNVQFNDVKPPQEAAFSPTGGSVEDTYYKYILGDGNWDLSSLDLDGDDKVLVTGDATLSVSDHLSLSGNSQIIIEEGASLDLYVAAETANIGGNGIANRNSNALSFGYYGLPSNQHLNYVGNTSFTGVIYAPDAEFRLGGGGNDTYDFVGASVTKTVEMNGHFNFHYDESLGHVGPSRGFIVNSWQEIDTPASI